MVKSKGSTTWLKGLGALLLGAVLGAAAVRLILPGAATVTNPAPPPTVTKAGTSEVAPVPSASSDGDAPSDVALPPLAREMQSALDRQAAIHQARAAAMTGDQRLEHVKRRILETDTSNWVWLGFNVGELRSELAQYIRPEDIPAMLKLAGELPEEEPLGRARFLRELTMELASTQGVESLVSQANALSKPERKHLLTVALEMAGREDPFASLALLRHEEEFPDYTIERNFMDKATQADPDRAFREAGLMRGIEMRSKAYTAVLANIAAGEGGLATALAKCKEITEPGLRFEVQENLLQALAEKSKGEEVLKYLAGPEIDPEFRNHGLRKILSSWGISGQKVLEWLNANPDVLPPADVDGIKQHAYYNYASSYPADALKRALTESGEARQRALEISMQTLAQSDFASAQAEMAKLSPADAALARPGYVQALAFKNPAEALTYFEQQDSSAPGHDKLVGSLMEGWSNVDVVAASEWLDQLEPGPARDQGAGALVLAASRNDPAAGAAWALQIQDPKIRRQSLNYVTAYWKSGAEDARAWILANTATLGPKETERLLDNIDI